MSSVSGPSSPIHTSSRNDPKLNPRAKAKGLHALLDFPGVIMTDSGTFQSHMYGEVELKNEDIINFQRDIGTDIGTVLDIFTEPDWTKEKTARRSTSPWTAPVEAAALKGEHAAGRSGAGLDLSRT